jgi:hypothetical protein
MHTSDPLLNGASDLSDTHPSPAVTDAEPATAAQAPATPQVDAGASAEAERLLNELCGINKPVVSVSDPTRPAI